MCSLVSIIVPVYNSELYLRKCVDSILSQTFKDFELILINDGSNDMSGDICDEYVSKDSRIKVIHKANGGVSSARNAGLKMAGGKWVTFIDSDDTIGENYFDIDFSQEVDLYVACSEVNNHTHVYEGIEMTMYLTENLCKECFRTPWGKFFNKATMGALFFDESIRLGEDTVFNLFFLKKCKRMVIVDNISYNYNESDFSVRYSMGVNEGIHIVYSINRAYKKLSIHCEKYETFIPRLISRICCKEKIDVFKYFTSSPVVKMYLNSFSLINYHPLIKYFKNIAYILFK